jgi:hypothetical protein
LYGAFGGNHNGTAYIVMRIWSYSNLLQRLDDYKGLTIDNSQLVPIRDSPGRAYRWLYIPQIFCKTAANQPTQLIFKKEAMEALKAK